MGQLSFFLISFVIAGSVIHLVNLWDMSIANELEKIRRERRDLLDKQKRERERRRREAWNRYHRQAGSSSAGAENDADRRMRAARNKSTLFYGEVLGIDPAAPPRDLKRVYRDMVSKYHPDKVQHLGREFQELAERKIKEINEAYDFFRNRIDCCR